MEMFTMVLIKEETEDSDWLDSTTDLDPIVDCSTQSLPSTLEAVKEEASLPEPSTSQMVVSSDMSQQSAKSLQTKHIPSTTQCDRKQVLECPVCGRAFASQSTFDRHLRVHDIIRKSADLPTQTKNILECPSCLIMFTSIQILRLHARTHVHNKTSETPYPCQICPQNFKSEAGLRNHYRKHKSKKYCRKCKNTFKSNTDFLSRQHQMDCRHKNVYRKKDYTKNNIFCNKCSKKIKTSYKTESALKCHELWVHESYGDRPHLSYTEQIKWFCRAKIESDPDQTTKFVISCGSCKHDIPALEYFDHLKTCNKFDYLLCPFCHKLIKDSEDSFLAHVRQHFNHNLNLIKCSLCIPNIKFFCGLNKILHDLSMHGQINNKDSESNVEQMKFNDTDSDWLDSTTDLDPIADCSTQSLSSTLEAVKVLEAETSLSDPSTLQMVASGNMSQQAAELSEIEESPSGTQSEHNLTLECFKTFSECLETETPEPKLETHNIRNSEITYTCQICTENFKSEIDLNNHNKNCKLKIYCKSCKFTFQSVFDGFSHKCKNKTKHCKKCSKVYFNESSLKFHVLWEHESFGARPRLSDTEQMKWFCRARIESDPDQITKFVISCGSCKQDLPALEYFDHFKNCNYYSDYLSCLFCYKNIIKDLFLLHVKDHFSRSLSYKTEKCTSCTPNVIFFSILNKKIHHMHVHQEKSGMQTTFSNDEDALRLGKIVGQYAPVNKLKTEINTDNFQDDSCFHSELIIKSEDLDA